MVARTGAAVAPCEQRGEKGGLFSHQYVMTPTPPGGGVEEYCISPKAT